MPHRCPAHTLCEYKNTAPGELKIARERYAYIPARLNAISDNDATKLGWESLKLDIDVPHDWAEGDTKSRKKYSSLDLDKFHCDLLDGEGAEQLMHGLLSVVFWGYIYGADGRVNPMFALSKCCDILRGKRNVSPQKADQIFKHLRAAQELLKASRISDALQETRKIKFLGMSFASKVLSAMNPNVATAYDTVISNWLKAQSSVSLRSLFVSTNWTTSKSERMHQGIIYQRWCQWCMKKAESLNASGMKWTDWSGDKWNWRAVDVERAIHALG